MRAPEVAVIDYNVGNLLSVRRGLERCGARVLVTSDPEEVVAAERVVLPGVGAFGSAMRTLTELGLLAAIRELDAQKTPLLCLCLGMQLLLEESEEFGLTAGLGLIPGRVVAIPPRTVTGDPQRVPHIGWNTLAPSYGARHWKGTLLEDIRPDDSMYFVHSFMVVPAVPEHRLADCLYGGHRVAAVIARDRIVGCQFHPEKSGEAGLTVLRRFLQSADSDGMPGTG